MRSRPNSNLAVLRQFFRTSAAAFDLVSGRRTETGCRSRAAQANESVFAGVGKDLGRDPAGDWRLAVYGFPR